MQDHTFPIPASVPKTNNTLEANANGTTGGTGTTDIQGGVVQDSNGRRELLWLPQSMMP
jgi:hypothetical protein